MGFASLYPSYGTCLRFLERLERVADIGVEPAAAGVQMRKDRFPHPRVPEFLDVLGDPRHGLVWPWL